MRPEDEKVLSLLRPYVAEWFRRKFGELTVPQREAIPLIKAGENVLISSPTGTGKTLAAFLGILDELFALGEKGELEDKVYAVYVSPLRALNNDMQRNLMAPLQEISELAEKEFGLKLPEIRVGVRTSDTPQSVRQAMIKKPPHILITTPESLAIVLVAPKFRLRLAGVKWVIVDEIHELASSKRGANLSILIERLEYLVGERLQRIGLSATIAPLEKVARFLGGYDDDGKPRPVKIVDARFEKPIDIKVLAPRMSLVYARAEELNESIYKLLADLIREHRSTLVFTNTRSATERVVYKLKKILGTNKLASMDEIEAHHGSLSRDLRLDVEKRLKEGKLRVVVSSTSLELGIDIGYIDLVVLLSSPKSVSRLLQRVGRAGHRIRDVSKGRIIVVDRDDLVECSVLAYAARKRLIDRVKIPTNTLDVLAQNLVAMSLEKKWSVEEAYRLVKRSYVFHKLPKKDFLRVLEFLGGKDQDLEHLKVYSKLWYDEVEGVFGRKRGARMIFYLNQGVIPDEAKVRVFLKNRRYIGDLEEDFVQILSEGDIFILGGKTYRFLRSEGNKVIVEPAEGLRPTVPSWYSEMLPLAFDSALLVGKFRRKISDMLSSGMSIDDVTRWAARELDLEEHAARQLVEYIWEQLVFTGGVVASDRLVHIEVYDDERARNIIFHTLFGRRTNDALSRAYALVLSRMLLRPVRVTVSDNAFMLTVAGHPQIDIEKLVSSVDKNNLRRLLSRALWNTELLKRRFRHCAQRSFMILRNYKGWEKSPHKLQLNAQAILEALKETDPEHPVLREALREIMEDYMDVEAAEKVLEWIRKGKIKLAITPPSRVPSPFAHHIVAMGFQDIVLMEDRRRLLQELHKRVMSIIGARIEKEESPARS